MCAPWEPSVNEIIYCDSQCILREDARVGRVCVHFPRVGYRVAVA